MQKWHRKKTIVFFLDYLIASFFAIVELSSAIIREAKWLSHWKSVYFQS
jgi:hypothetical protein